MQGLLVMEVAITTVDWQSRGGNGYEEGSGPPLNHFVTFSRGNHDDLVTEAHSGSELSVDIGAHAAAGGRVKSADIDNSHGGGKPGNAGNLK